MKRAMRETWGWTQAENLWQDIRYTLRTLHRSPGFTAAVVLTLALGIGANTAMFSVVHSVLLRPLPYRNPGRLFRVMVHTPLSPGGPSTAIGSEDFTWLRDQVSSFEGMAAYRPVGVVFRGGRPEWYAGQQVTTGMFQVLGVDPIAGRDFRPEEHKPAGPEVIIISYRLWQRRFGGDPTIIGKQIRLGGLLDGPFTAPVESSLTLVGVMPPDFEAPRESGSIGGETIDFWLPYEVGRAGAATGTVIPESIARLKEGVTAREAISEMSVAAAGFELTSPNSQERRFSLRPLRDDLLQGRYARVLWILLGAVAFVVLIAIANVASLFLARRVTREREITIRTMLGAGRWRLFQQRLTESLVLAAIGGLAGFLLAYGALPIIASLLPPEISRGTKIYVEMPVLAFTLGVSIIAGILLGLLPVSRTESGGFAPNRLRSAFTAVEIGLAIVLLIGAGLLMRSFWLLTNTELGFDSKNLITTRINGIMSETPDPYEHLRYWQQVIERTRALPGVDSAALAYVNILGTAEAPLRAGVRLTPDREDIVIVRCQVVSDDYFRVLRVPLLRGRSFAAQDHLEALPAAIVNETMAQRFWPGENPIGKQIYAGHSQLLPPRTVIGVVRDVREGGFGWAVEPVMYVYYRQDPRVFSLLIRTASDPENSIKAIESTLRSIDPDVPIPAARTAESVLNESVGSPRFRWLLLAAFAAIALTLALIGVYGVVAYTASQRTREIGVRMALGAEAAHVIWLVLRQNMMIVLFGMTGGLLASLWLTRFLSGMLFEITAFDALTYAVVCLLLLLASLLACYFPARRASRIDPMLVLRHE